MCYPPIRMGSSNSRHHSGVLRDETFSHRGYTLDLAATETRSDRRNPRRRRPPAGYGPIIKPGSRAAELAARPIPVGDPEITISFTIRKSKGPALRSAVEELSSIIGSRLEGQHKYDKEFALTDAAITVGSLRAAVNKAIPAGDPAYV